MSIDKINVNFCSEFNNRLELALDIIKAKYYLVISLRDFANTDRLTSSERDYISRMKSLIENTISAPEVNLKIPYINYIVRYAPYYMIIYDALEIINLTNKDYSTLEEDLIGVVAGSIVGVCNTTDLKKIDSLEAQLVNGIEFLYDAVDACSTKTKSTIINCMSTLNANTCRFSDDSYRLNHEQTLANYLDLLHNNFLNLYDFSRWILNNDKKIENLFGEKIKLFD